MDNMSNSELSQSKQRYSLEDIDERLENFSELATVLGIDTKQIMFHILTSLKLKLNNEVKKTSDAKRQRLLEYLFPYAVLPDYSPLVKYLLEKEEDIPDIIVDKLLQDPTYKAYLTPTIKVNIYKKRISYFKKDVNKVLETLPIPSSLSASIYDKRCVLRMLIDKNDTPEEEDTSLDSVFQLAVNDEYLYGIIVVQLIRRAVSIRQTHSSDDGFQVFNQLYKFLQTHPSSLLFLSTNSLDLSQRQQIILLLQTMEKRLSAIIKNDETVVIRSDRSGQHFLYSSIFELLKKSLSIKSENPNDAFTFEQKRSSLYREMISEMIALDTQHTFSVPVDTCIVTDYTQCISNPINLSMMKQKVDQYKSIADIRNDIDLIVSNAQTYNGITSPIAIQARSFRQDWYSICTKYEKKEKRLRQSLNIINELSRPESSKSLDSISEGLDYALLFLSIAISTPSFYSQLLRAIYQRISRLFEDGTPVTNNNYLDSMIYSYYQLLSLSNHVLDFLNRITGQSDYFPTSLFSNKVNDDVPKEHCEMIKLLFFHIASTAAGSKDEDLHRSLIQCLSVPGNRYLLYSSIISQCCQVTRVLTDKSINKERMLFGSLLQVLIDYSDPVLISEWSWIDAIVSTLVFFTNKNIMHALDVFLICFICPALKNQLFFTKALHSLMFLLEQACNDSNNCDTLLNIVSKRIVSANIPKQQWFSLSHETQTEISNFISRLTEFRVILLQLFEDYTIESNGSIENDLLTSLSLNSAKRSYNDISLPFEKESDNEENDDIFF